MHKPSSSSGRPDDFRRVDEVDPEGCKGGLLWIEASAYINLTDPVEMHSYQNILHVLFEADLLDLTHRFHCPLSTNQFDDLDHGPR
jgi:hypothetical protein